MTNYSRSVLLSNGFPYSKIWLKKFDFSPIDTPANIAQKLPSQRCFKPLLIPIFNFPHNAPRLLSQAKWVHTRLSEKDRTQGHTQRNRGRFGWGGYHYPRSVLRGSETLRGRVSERRTLPLLGLGRMYSQRTQKAFVTAMRMMRVAVTRRRGPAGLRRPTPPAERTVLAPISPRVQLCLRRPAFPLSAFIPGA